MTERQPQGEHQHETRLDPEQHASGGGLRYQQAARDPERTRQGITPADTEANANVGAADQQQRAEDFGGPEPEAETILQDHGYPKLGGSLNSRVTQVEHGPYAGGTQQGTPETRAAAGPTHERAEPSATLPDGTHAPDAQAEQSAAPGHGRR